MAAKKDPTTALTEPSSEVSLGKLFETYVPDTVKRALFTGAGMLFMTEEGIRRATYLIKQSEKGKEEFFASLQKEMHWFLSRIDTTRLLKNVLDDLSLELHATVTLHAGKGSANPAAEGKPKKAVSRKKKSRD
jgi:hypothetical protein